MLLELVLLLPVAHAGGVVLWTASSGPGTDGFLCGGAVSGRGCRFLVFQIECRFVVPCVVFKGHWSVFATLSFLDDSVTIESDGTEGLAT